MRTVLAVLAILLAALSWASALSEPNNHESNYNTAGMTLRTPHGPQFDYNDFRTWPQLCQTGRRQSPISFVNVEPKEVIKREIKSVLNFSSHCVFPAEDTDLKIDNDIRMISASLVPRLAVPGDRSPCHLQDPLDPNTTYYFVGMHFHANAEHLFRNVRPDAELHINFVADSAEDTAPAQRLTLAVLLKASSSINSSSVRALRHMLLEGRLPPVHASTTCTLTEELDLQSLLPARESYLAYDGSRTYPPCTEDVRWIVLTTPVYISRAGLGKLRDAMTESMPNDFHRFGNARPPQALSGRRIYRFVDHDHDDEPESAKLVDVWSAAKHSTVSPQTAAKAVRDDASVRVSNQTEPVASSDASPTTAATLTAFWKSHKGRWLAILILVAVVVVVVATVVHRWRKPSVVAGINPEELNLLNKGGSAYQYGARDERP